MRYVLNLEPFLLRLRANHVLRGITLLGGNIAANYSAYDDDVYVFAKGVRKSAKKYAGTKGCSGQNQLWLAVGRLEGRSLLEHFN